jgi:hypothetical protein
MSDDSTIKLTFPVIVVTCSKALECFCVLQCIRYGDKTRFFRNSAATRLFAFSWMESAKDVDIGGGVGVIKLICVIYTPMVCAVLYKNMSGEYSLYAILYDRYVDIWN